MILMFFSLEVNNKVHKPIDMETFAELLKKNRHVNPRQR